jgi:AcrR family transcriptional regulator
MGTPRLPRAERREQVLRAAATAFVRGGFDGTSMDDVAREAGVTRLIVYRIFETKDALYRAVLDDVTADLYHTFEGADLAEIGVAKMLLDIARRHPDGFRLLWRHAAHEPEFAELAAVFRDLVTAYAETLIAGDPGAAPHDPVFRHWVAQSLVSYHYEGVCTWLDDGDPARDDEFVAIARAGSRSLIGAWMAQASAR